ncbi:hypothetical protein BJ508DRAFT_419110 [Ascobolus immersus RN42]|uniref:Uncharacterized protein n=1 Tax=Ascobolus immersus RN42 TaxID=1160509 RepID=A0A3N4HGW6_ASCIM|nr:hypothetical protein BJ508DRAFT_419110 [Ascobolus immersus RN42]
MLPKAPIPLPTLHRNHPLAPSSPPSQDSIETPSISLNHRGSQSNRPSTSNTLSARNPTFLPALASTHASHRTCASYLPISSTSSFINTLFFPSPSGSSNPTNPSNPPIPQLPCIPRPAIIRSTHRSASHSSSSRSYS